MTLKPWPEKPDGAGNQTAALVRLASYERARADAAMERLRLLAPLLEEANGGLRDYIYTIERTNGAALYYGKDLMKRITEALAAIGPLPALPGEGSG